MSDSSLVVSQPAPLSFGDPSRFDHIQRVAAMFSKSQLVPLTFQNNVPNVVIALEIAERIGCSGLMVMQNLNIIHGKPSFGASFMIAAINACGRFSSLRFTTVGDPTTDSWGCFASAKAKSDGHECKGVLVTMKIAKDEGWYGKSGSKWKTMPELMLNYRAATWWARTFAPELLMGFPTQDEVYDIDGAQPAQEPLPRVAKNKGVAGMKTVTEVTNVERELDEAPQPPPVQEPLPKTVSEAEPPAAEELAKVERLPVRVEVLEAVEKMAKKAGGVVGPVTTVTLAGEYVGQAFYDGIAALVPAPGTIMDAFLSDKDLKGVKVKILESFTVVE